MAVQRFVWQFVILAVLSLFKNHYSLAADNTENYLTRRNPISPILINQNVEDFTKQAQLYDFPASENDANMIYHSPSFTSDIIENGPKIIQAAKTGFDLLDIKHKNELRKIVGKLLGSLGSGNKPAVSENDEVIFYAPNTRDQSEDMAENRRSFTSTIIKNGPKIIEAGKKGLEFALKHEDDIRKVLGWLFGNSSSKDNNRRNLMYLGDTLANIQDQSGDMEASRRSFVSAIKKNGPKIIKAGKKGLKFVREHEKDIRKALDTLFSTCLSGDSCESDSIDNMRQDQSGDMKENRRSFTSTVIKNGPKIIKAAKEGLKFVREHENDIRKAVDTLFSSCLSADSCESDFIDNMRQDQSGDMKESRRSFTSSVIKNGPKIFKAGMKGLEFIVDHEKDIKKVLAYLFGGPESKADELRKIMYPEDKPDVSENDDNMIYHTPSDTSDIINKGLKIFAPGMKALEYTVDPESGIENVLTYLISNPDKKVTVANIIRNLLFSEDMPAVSENDEVIGVFIPNTKDQSGDMEQNRRSFTSTVIKNGPKIIDAGKKGINFVLNHGKEIKDIFSSCLSPSTCDE